MEGQLRGCPCLDALRTCRTHPTPQTTAILFSPPDHGSPHDRGAQTGLWPLEPSFEKHLTGGGFALVGVTLSGESKSAGTPPPSLRERRKKPCLLAASCHSLSWSLPEHS